MSILGDGSVSDCAAELGSGKRQVNDKHDAAVMCRRLSEYLDGHRKALSIVHIPTREEEEKRAEGRFREQLVGKCGGWRRGVAVFYCREKWR